MSMPVVARQPTRHDTELTKRNPMNYGASRSGHHPL